MSFIEFLGFVISLVAMIFIFLKRSFEERRRKSDPEAYAERERRREQALKKFYKQLQIQPEADEEEENVDEEEYKQPPPIPSVVHTTRVLPRGALTEQRRIQQANKRSTIDIPKYQVNRVRRDSRGGMLIHRLNSSRDMLVLKEIFDKPLAIRDNESR